MHEPCRTELSRTESDQKSKWIPLGPVSRNCGGVGNFEPGVELDDTAEYKSALRGSPGGSGRVAPSSGCDASAAVRTKFGHGAL